MKTRKRKKHKDHKKTASHSRQPPAIQKPSWPIRSKIGTAVAFLASLVTLYALWVPRLVVQQLPPLVSSRIVSVPFQITNDGYLPIYNVAPECRIWSVVTNDFLKINGAGNISIRQSPPEERVSAGESFAASCDQFDHVFTTAVKGAKGDNFFDIREADIEIRITMIPFLSPFQVTKRFRFVTRQASDGTLRWLPASVGVK